MKNFLIAIIFLVITLIIAGLTSLKQGCSNGSISFGFIWQYAPRILYSGPKIPIVYDGSVIGYQQEGCAPYKIIVPIEPILFTIIFTFTGIYKKGKRQT